MRYLSKMALVLNVSLLSFTASADIAPVANDSITYICTPSPIKGFSTPDFIVSYTFFTSDIFDINALTTIGPFPGSWDDFSGTAPFTQVTIKQTEFVNGEVVSSFEDADFFAFIVSDSASMLEEGRQFRSIKLRPNDAPTISIATSMRATSIRPRYYDDFGFDIDNPSTAVITDFFANGGIVGSGKRETRLAECILDDAS
ncbi:MAG: hypothetical protein AAGB12_02750 [Pseudomonadota bacterium]